MNTLKLSWADCQEELNKWALDNEIYISFEKFCFPAAYMFELTDLNLKIKVLRKERSAVTNFIIYENGERVAKATKMHNDIRLPICFYYRTTPATAAQEELVGNLVDLSYIVNALVVYNNISKKSDLVIQSHSEGEDKIIRITTKSEIKRNIERAKSFSYSKEFEVRGHYRKMANGKSVYVHAYKKGSKD